MLHEVDAKRVLAEAGIAVVEERLVATAEDAAVAAHEIGYPVVLKVVADALPHKTEHGLVEIGLDDDHAVQAAWDALEQRLSRIEPSPEIAGIVVQRMVSGGIEAIAGIKRDPDFGLVMAVGPGGVLVEVLDQVALRPLPLRSGDAEAMIDDTMLGRLLDGARGQPGDREALVALLYALADFAYHESAEIAEIELNPIIVSAPGEGCAAVDALIVPLCEG